MEDRARNQRVVLPDGSEEWRFPYETPSYASDIWLRRLPLRNQAV